MSANKVVQECSLCHRMMRLPVMDTVIIVTCPHCKDRVEVLNGKPTEKALTAQQYVLMLQFPFEYLDEFEKMVRVEEQLLTREPKGWDLDFHKSGENGFTWPVFTKNPEECFRQLKAAFTPADLESLTAVYCPMEPLEPNNLTYLWPREGDSLKFDDFPEFHMIS